MTDRVEKFIAPNGRLWSELRAKKKRKTSAKRKRTQKMDSDLAKRKRELWDTAEALHYGPVCGLCGLYIILFEDCAACHRTSRGMGGGKRKDSDIFLGHHTCNFAQGSMSLAAYLSKYTLEERRLICQGKPIKGKA